MFRENRQVLISRWLCWLYGHISDALLAQLLGPHHTRVKTDSIHTKWTGLTRVALNRTKLTKLESTFRFVRCVLSLALNKHYRWGWLGSLVLQAFGYYLKYYAGKKKSWMSVQNMPICPNNKGVLVRTKVVDILILSVVPKNMSRLCLYSGCPNKGATIIHVSTCLSMSISHNNTPPLQALITTLHLMKLLQMYSLHVGLAAGGMRRKLMEHSETLFIIFLLLYDGFSTAAIYFSRKSVILSVSL